MNSVIKINGIGMPQSSKLWILMLIIFSSCLNEKKSISNTNMSENMDHQITKFEGNYVSEMYDRRDEGYDWVSVMVEQKNDSVLHISIRSRADLKKPSCTFDAYCARMNDSTYFSNVEGQFILFTFQNNTVRIGPKTKSDENILYYFCSGGASLADTYTKIEGELDQDQIDRTIFEKALELQGIRFYVNQTVIGKKKLLTIKPSGLEIRNDTIKLTVDEIVTGAETEDLNSDGSPELIIYTFNQETKKGNVIGFSANKKKSLSQAYLPPIEFDQKASKGYGGYDEFAIVETSLVRRFPVFVEGKRTKKMKQIQYKLEEGEAMRKFVINRITEY